MRSGLENWETVQWKPLTAFKMIFQYFNLRNTYIHFCDPKFYHKGIVHGTGMQWCAVDFVQGVGMAQGARKVDCIIS